MDCTAEQADAAVRTAVARGVNHIDIAPTYGMAETVAGPTIGALRNQLGVDLGLIEDRWAPCWVVDWPMFERGREGRLDAMHHPFTSPACSVEELRANPEAARAGRRLGRLAASELLPPPAFCDAPTRQVL